MEPFFAELIGTFLLVLLGNGVVANVLLPKTKGHQGGWLVITTGWGLAVFVAVASVDQYSGAHINPAVTIGLAAAGEFAWSLVPTYLAAQFAGGLLGAVVVYLFYHAHYQLCENPDEILSTFCTMPAIRRPVSNFISEVIGTFVLVYVVLSFAAPEWTASDPNTSGLIGLGAVGAIPVGLLVFAIGICLGGTTGYAINPARDFSPRLAHFLLPISGKRDSDWSYAWIPLLGPTAGGLLAALLYRVAG